MTQVPRPKFIDVSSYNSTAVEWDAYKEWSKQADGISRLSMRASYGYGYTDTAFPTFRKEALAAGIEKLVFYHYAYPQYTTAQHSADWHALVLANIRENDSIMLDMEENVPSATGDWAFNWCEQMSIHYPHNPITIYASRSFILSHLQDERLTKYGLHLADWTYNPDETPSCPPPWKEYQFMQYSDREKVPGVTGNVDANVVMTGDFNPPLPQYMQQQMKDTWGWWSKSVALVVPPYDTGIATAWKNQYSTQNYGSPIGEETNSVDWDGNPIKLQYFTSGVRAEWDIKAGGPCCFYHLGTLLYKGF